MSNKIPTPLIFLIIIIFLTVLVGGTLWWYFGSKTETKRCTTDIDCVLAYTGSQPCAPCNYSDPDYQCVSPEQAENFQEKSAKRKVLCEICPRSPLLFRCFCKNNTCIKTVDCSNDNDCYSKSFGNQYKCVNNKCSSPAVTNTNTNTNQVDCSSITDRDTCYNRSDCLPVDFCDCTTEQLKAKRCGYEVEDPCVCDFGGFSRCEKLTCPTTNTNTTTNTNITSTDQESCEAQGGKWGAVGLFPEPVCNLPTSDGGQECSNGDECEANWCIAELTDEEVKELSKEGVIEKKGACPKWRTVVGCIYTVSNGQVQGPVLCID